MRAIFLILFNIATFLVASEHEIVHHYIGQIIYHDGQDYSVTSCETNQFPFDGKKEYSEIIIIAERPVKIFGFEFAKDTLRKTVKQGKNPSTGSITISENSAITRSYALKSYIIGILFIYSLSKSLIAEMNPPTCIVNRI